MAFVGSYFNGIPGGGPCWLFKEGGGYLYGHPDCNGEFTGNDIAYIYPDFYTCYVGHFQSGIMINAVEETVQGAELSDQNIMHLNFSSNQVKKKENVKMEYKKKHFTMSQNGNKRMLMKSSKLNAQQTVKVVENGDQVFLVQNGVNLSMSTRTYIGDHPLRSDPYETRLIECRESKIPNSGLGLFAKCNLPKDTIVAFYNGVRLPFEILGRPAEDWATSGYKIHVNADYISGLRMDIPAELATDLSQYCATLGHKMNHSFQSNCFAWFFDHPRKG